MERTLAAEDQVMARTSARTTFAVLTLVVAVGAGLLASCVPTSGRYVDQVFASATKTTVVYRDIPDLTTGAPLRLRTDIFQPTGDRAARRPAIVWVHGGGFKGGDRTNLTAVAEAWARRGFVTLSIDYRLDPGNRCQDIQRGLIADPVQLEAETQRCSRAIYAAQNDAFAAIGWLRRNAEAYRVDTTRIAVGGGSAGAITAINVGQRANEPGGPVPSSRKVRAVLSMSGCQYDLPAIDRFDAPLSTLGSGDDPSTPFACVQATADRTEAVGVPVQRLYYPADARHAQALYNAYRADVDRAWTSFLWTHLDLGRAAT